jgi:cell division protein FtsN
VAATGGGRGDWSVQLGAFGERANAVQLEGRVADLGFEAQVSEFRSSGRTMYRVRIEGFATRERAEAARSSLAAHGIIPANVVPAD